jgi:LPXTG-site transpeptidase (sortase) family protein
MIKNRFNKKPGDLLGESAEAVETEKEKVSVFENKLKPMLTSPTSLKIKAAGITVGLVPVNVDSDGIMETPNNWQEAGWYIKGGKPGESRNLIINGHYDTNTGAPGAFYNLRSIQYGDVVEIEDKYGRIFTYKVVELAHLDIKDPSRLEVLEDVEGKSTLTLITCGGVYLQGSGYNKRLVVKAELL